MICILSWSVAKSMGHPLHDDGFLAAIKAAIKRIRGKSAIIQTMHCCFVYIFLII